MTCSVGKKINSEDPLKWLLHACRKTIIVGEIKNCKNPWILFKSLVKLKQGVLQAI